MSAIPVERMNSTALATTPRGSREYGVLSTGLCTENKITNVFSLRYGSRKADDGTGSNFISDSWIAWKPRIDEPSNIKPSVKTASSNDSTGTLKWC